MSGGAPHSQPAESRPIPDPTALTTQQLLWALANLEKQMGAEFRVITTRLDAMDKAMTLFQDSLTRVPTDVDKQVGNLRGLHDSRFGDMAQRFAAVEALLAERDKRADLQASAAATAVSAALESSKAITEAQSKAAKDLQIEQNKYTDNTIARIEGSTTRQLEALEAVVQTGERAANARIAEIKDDLTRIKGQGAGISTAYGVAVGAAGLLLGLGGFVFALTR